jgi:hypothetical protein
MIRSEKSVVLFDGEKHGAKRLLVQMPPNIRTLKFVLNDHFQFITHLVRLALPYMLFYVRRNDGHNSLRLAFSPKPLQFDKDEIVFFPFLPCVFEDDNWAVCLGDDKYEPLELEEVIDNFWQTGFRMYSNNFLSSEYWRAPYYLKGTFLKSFEHWAKLTKEKGSPDFMLDFEELYKNYPTTLKMTLQDFAPMLFSEQWSSWF